jgi:hypothetical protein
MYDRVPGVKMARGGHGIEGQGLFFRRKALEAVVAASAIVDDHLRLAVLRHECWRPGLQP